MWTIIHLFVWIVLLPIVILFAFLWLRVLIGFVVETFEWIREIITAIGDVVVYIVHDKPNEWQIARRERKRLARDVDVWAERTRKLDAHLAEMDASAPGSTRR